MRTTKQANAVHDVMTKVLQQFLSTEFRTLFSTVSSKLNSLVLLLLLLEISLLLLLEEDDVDSNAPPELSWFAEVSDNISPLLPFVFGGELEEDVEETTLLL